MKRDDEAIPSRRHLSIGSGWSREEGDCFAESILRHEGLAMTRNPCHAVEQGDEESIRKLNDGIKRNSLTSFD